MDWRVEANEIIQDLGVDTHESCDDSCTAKSEYDQDVDLLAQRLKGYYLLGENHALKECLTGKETVSRPLINSTVVGKCGSCGGDGCSSCRATDESSGDQ